MFGDEYFTDMNIMHMTAFYQEITKIKTKLK